MKELFKGSAVALITPMKEDGGVNFIKLRELIERQIEAGTKAILVCGTTGEGSTLTDREFKKIIREARRGSEGHLPLLAGAGSNNTLRSVEKGKIAAAEGADGVLQLTPFYNKTNSGGILRHFETIADASPVPVIMYNVPSRTGYDIPVSAIKELSLHPNIIGIKEASSDIEKTAAIISVCAPSFSVYSGNDGQILPVLALGGKGVISVAANIIPKEIQRICEKGFSGDNAGAAAIGFKYYKLIKTLFCEVNPIPVKAAMNILGMKVGETRLPLYKMGEENFIRLSAVLKELMRKEKHK